MTETLSQQLQAAVDTIDRVTDEIRHEKHDNDSIDQLSAHLQLLSHSIDDLTSSIRYAANNLLDGQWNPDVACALKAIARQQPLSESIASEKGSANSQSDKVVPDEAGHPTTPTSANEKHREISTNPSVAGSSGENQMSLFDSVPADKITEEKRHVSSQLNQQCALVPVQSLTDFTNAQLLAELLPKTDAEKLDEPFPIRWLADALPGELRIRTKSYQRLQIAVELGRRVLEFNNLEGIVPKKITGVDDAIAYCRQKFFRIVQECKQEQFYVVTLDTKNKPIGDHLVTQGTLDASLVHPREVFRPATRDAASSVLLAHNHPSGDPTPSPQDLAVTSRMKDAGKLLGIDVLDHIVMARDGFVSIEQSR
ncbi:MAG: JAB domain-containing protein [Planctomycetota bacterium]